MEASLFPPSSHGTTDEQEDDLGSFSSFNTHSAASVGSSSSEMLEDASSSAFPADQEKEEGPLFEMSCLISHLPLARRGLSKHFQGKSRSFSSLSEARSLKDLAKPERARKRGLSCSKTIAKKPSRGGSFSTLGLKKQSFLSRPPIPPRRSSGNLSSKTLLFV